MVVIESGRWTSCSAAVMASTASPIEAPGAVLNDKVTEGCCDWRLTVSGWVTRRSVATSSSRTIGALDTPEDVVDVPELEDDDELDEDPLPPEPVCARMKTRPSADGIVLQGMARFENDLVIRRFGENRRNLVCSIGVVERGADLVGGQAESRRLVMVDVDGDRRIADLQIRIHVAQHRQLLQFRQHLWRHLIEGVEIGRLRAYIGKARARRGRR